MRTCIIPLQLIKRIAMSIQVFKANKVLRIVKLDGNVLEYPRPVLVRDLLSKFQGHAVAISNKVRRYLPSDYQLRVGKVYHLLPLEGQGNGRDSETAASSAPVAKEKRPSESVKRIKIVITKQQLQEMFSSKSVTLEEMLTKLQGNSGGGGSKRSDVAHRRWRPQLDTIAEAYHE